MAMTEFYLDSHGKGKLHCCKWTPTQMPKAVVQIVHGIAEYAERYDAFARFLNAHGIAVVAEDHMGHGKSVGNDLPLGYFYGGWLAAVADSYSLMKKTMTEYPGIPYILFGHSMGSFIARNYICRYGTGIDAAVIMGTGMQPGAVLRAALILAGVQKLFYGSRHVSKLIDKMAFGGYGSKIANPRTPWDWLSRDEERVDRYIADPMCGFTFTVNGFGALFTLVSRLHSQENLKAVPKDLPVFMVSGDADPVGDYGKGVRRAYDSLVAAGLKDISLKLYEGARHELLNETNRAEVMEDILKWVQSKVLKQ